jgi:hypothetical protein
MNFTDPTFVLTFLGWWLARGPGRPERVHGNG